MVDMGYDVVNHCSIDPLFGTIDDFKDLCKATHSLGFKNFSIHLMEIFRTIIQGIHLILDFILNHTSDQHEWFLASVQRSPIYEDYYVWHDGKIDPETGLRIEPNNWKSCFGEN
uniref:alpha-glucosidase n=1 Tax=Romanomermis culicivorax TaxID=13658 RepID=A0A915JPF5_ROMCU